jgi:hypothetical protein
MRTDRRTYILCTSAQNGGNIQGCGVQGESIEEDRMSETSYESCSSWLHESLESWQYAHNALVATF